MKKKNQPMRLVLLIIVKTILLLSKNKMNLLNNLYKKRHIEKPIIECAIRHVL